MTRPVPFTKAGLKRAIKALEECGHTVAGIDPDGRVIVDKPDSDVPVFPASLHHDAYAIAASGVRHAEKTRKRRARAS